MMSVQITLKSGAVAQIVIVANEHQDPPTHHSLVFLKRSYNATHYLRNVAVICPLKVLAVAESYGANRKVVVYSCAAGFFAEKFVTARWRSDVRFCGPLEFAHKQPFDGPYCRDGAVNRSTA